VALKTNFGVVALSSGGIGILNGKTKTAIAPLLNGELGNVGGTLFDVAISPDGKTTLVSNFGDSKVFFIDTTSPAIPFVIGSVNIGFFAEDIDITPDGRYALVSDGGFSPKVAVLDVRNRTLIEVFEDSANIRSFQSIAVAKDGETVLGADYWGGKVHVLTLSNNGHLTFRSSIDVSANGKFYPVNVAVSPDGYTAIVAVTNMAQIAIDFPILTIWEPGKVELTDWVTPSIKLTGSQSIAFNRSGSKAYIYCVQALPEDFKPKAAEEVEPPPLPNNVIVALSVPLPGEAVQVGTPMEVDFSSTSQLFGVDTLAMDQTEGYLYVSNMTSSGSKNHVQVLDVKTGTVVKTISFDPYGSPPDENETIPTGVTFWNPIQTQ
jgi:DNA-binding beta-propeller fold protein YncE